MEVLRFVLLSNFRLLVTLSSISKLNRSEFSLDVVISWSIKLIRIPQGIVLLLGLKISNIIVSPRWSNCRIRIVFVETIPHD